jgi:hypothetical protein
MLCINNLIKFRFAFPQKRKKEIGFCFFKTTNFSSLRTAKSESRNYQLISKNLGDSSQICPPRPEPKARARRLIQSGGVYWTMLELSLSKIQRILPIDPPSVSARLRFASASKTEKFS